ncbi:Histone-lysine N-methyltransferase 2E [Echinococcus granulosus]|uniref:Histone lysine N methyltransferase MLL5 n=1 Tax=Echinococcus granulosus TaxID=6210 RepID=A0A068WJU3_ECHGR|nr:Histone-lysine N-methyltransferase 2E [Echinococcus granulosus]CDS20048.1 histone lysine N methyltransferase MLL5 [Echinococcus granulosus]
MDVKCENLQNDEFPLTILHFNEDLLVPEIGSTVVISENQTESVCDSPSKIWTGKRVLCSFSANNADLDDYPFHAVTYGEPGELYGLPYNDHNYAKVWEEESNSDNQLALLAKVALSRKESTDVEIQRSDSSGNGNMSNSTEVISSPGYRSPSVPHVTIIKTPFLNQNYQTSSSIQQKLSGPTCKVATSNGRTILLTPSRGNLGASVQIHRVSSVNTSQVLLRTDFASTGVGNVSNGISSTFNGSIRCICGFTRDDGCLVQCTNCKVFQHAECMAPSSSSILPKPYRCELCQPRPVMISEAIGLQRRKMAICNTSPSLATKTIRLTGPTAAFRLPRSNVPTTPRVHNPTVAPNRFFLTGGASGQSTAATSLSVRPIQVRLGEVVGSSSGGAALYQVDSAALNHFSPRFINLDTAVARQQSQPYMTTVGNQRSSKRKQDLFTLAGESVSFDAMTSNYSYDEANVANGQHMPVSANNDHTNTLSCGEGNELPGPKFYRTPSQVVGSVCGLDVIEGAKPQSSGSLATAFSEVTGDVSAVTGLSTGVPEPASPDVVIWSDSYEKAAETRLSDALKQRIRNIFLTPSERELKTLQMADSFALSRGQQRCRVTSFELGRKGLIATECIYPNQPVIEYKGYAMLLDEYTQQHNYKRHYNPFVLFYKQLDKAAICLDASNYGNEARFIRRSCMPNCEVRLTFPPADSFSSVVNPQCIQFVVTSSISRVIPAGTELTLAFDFDYTACYYPVRCACGRGAPLCAVADWLRRHHHSSSSLHGYDYCDAEEGHRRTADEDQGEGDCDFDDIDDGSEAIDYQYDRNPLSHRSRHHHGFVEKTTHSRIALKRLLNSKHVSPAFSRVPYPSAKHMVQEQYRRHQNGMPAAFGLSKRGFRGVRGTRGSGRGRGGGGLIRQQQQHLRASRPRGRPPSSSIKRNLVRRPPPLCSPLQRHNSDVEEEEREEEDGVNHCALPTSSSPRTDVTEPGATSPWTCSTRSSAIESRVHCFGNIGVNKKGSARREQHQIRQRRSSKMHSPRRTCRRSSMGTSNGPVTSPVMPPEADSVFIERPSEELKSPISAMSKAKRVRKTGGRLSNGVDGSPRLFEKGSSSAAKRTRRQSNVETCDHPLGEQGDGEDKTKEKALTTRSSKSREDNWLAEVMRRIERMEKKRKKNPTKKPKVDIDNKSVEPEPELHPPKPLFPDQHEDKKQVEVKEEIPLKSDEALKGELLVVPKKALRKPASSASTGSHPPTTPLSREDRWMQWQIQRIAEMESSDAPAGDHLQHQSTSGSSIKQRRRCSSGAKSSLPRRSPQKKETSDRGTDGAGGEAECSLIVYKRREQDPMAKFSRSRTGNHHRQQQNFLNRSYSLVESFVDEDLPAGGELLDDHSGVVGANGASNFNDPSCSNAVPSVGSSSPPKPSKKRWLSQALMEEDQQHQQNPPSRTTPSPVDSLTPPDSTFNPLNFQNQRALNPKKRIISQLEEAMAQQRQSPSPLDSHIEVSPSSDAPTPASRLPLKKRQSEEDTVGDGSRPGTPRKPKLEKVRMSLSEYRRRRGLSTASVESTGANKAQALPPVVVPVSLSTPPGSPAVDLKRLALPSLPLVPPTSEFPLGGPRTPSEPPSDEDEEKRMDISLPTLSTPFLHRSQQPPPLSAPASLPSPMQGTVERFHDSFSIDSSEKPRASPPPHRPPGGCDRHLSGHAQRRASPPPPPHLGSASDSATPPVSPTACYPPPVEHILRRDREILQWQMERKHQDFQPSTARLQRSSHTSSSSTTHLEGNHARSYSISTPPQPSASRSHAYPNLAQSLASAPPTTAFNHHDMESIQETLRRKQEHLRAQLRDLQKAAASGSG